MEVFVYSASGDNEEIKVFSTLEKAIAYANSKYYVDAEFEKNGNRWFYDCEEDPVEILKLEIE